MKNKRFALFLSAFIIIASSFSILATASSTSLSLGKVEFGDKEITPPVDPENPTLPQEPSEGGETGQTGNLTLDVVPHPYFGRNPVPIFTTTINSKIVRGRSGNVTPGAQTFIQVSEARPFMEGKSGTPGWSVSVTANAFTNIANSANLINGAKLIFEPGSIGGPDDGLTAQPMSHSATLNCVNDDSANEEKIFLSPEGGVIGVWVSKLYQSPWNNPAEGEDNLFIKLYVPAGSGVASGGEYVATLTWSMNDAP